MSTEWPGAKAAHSWLGWLPQRGLESTVEATMGALIGQNRDLGYTIYYEYDKEPPR